MFDYSKVGLKRVEIFFESLENGNYEVAKKQVGYVLEERINHFKIADEVYNQEIFYSNKKIRVLEQGQDYIVIRANYTLIKRNDLENIRKPVTMDLYLKPLEIKENGKTKKDLRIIYLKEV
jgi:hypothetical protein